MARYLDDAALHAGGRLISCRIPTARVFCGFSKSVASQGIFIFDEPESALSPSRQIEFLKLLRRMDESKISQVIMATHSPMIMAYPNATLLRLTKAGLEPVRVADTEHYKLMRHDLLISIHRNLI